MIDSVEFTLMLVRTCYVPRTEVGLQIFESIQASFKSESFLYLGKNSGCYWHDFFFSPGKISHLVKICTNIWPQKLLSI